MLTISGLTAAIGTNVPPNRIVFSALDGNNQPQFLVADGATLNLKLEANPTNLVFTVKGQEYTINADDTVAVTTGFAANNTAQFNDTVNTGGVTKYLGEDEGTKILLSATGTEISSRVNKQAAFMTINGGNTEYFIGTIRFDGVAYYIENCYRGFFFDSSGTLERVELAAAQVITILRLSWIFVKTDGSFTYNTSNNEPYVQGSTPAAPAANDLWYDTVNEKWMIYSGGSFIDFDGTFCGWSCQDSGTVEATRSLDLYADRKPLCDIGLVLNPENLDEKIISYRRGGKVDVNGVGVDLTYKPFELDITTDLDTGAVAADKIYWIYIKDDLDPEASLIKPFDRQGDLKGYYHPAKPYRCVGFAYTDAAADFEDVFTLGSESQLADHSVSNRKLSKYKYIKDEATREELHGIPNSQELIMATGQSSTLTIRTSGRPVMLLFKPDQGISYNFISMVALNTFVVTYQRRQLPSPTWVDIDQGTGVTSGNDIINLPSMVLTNIDFPPAGQHQYRMNVTIAGTISMRGRFIAFEL